jgi:hypothetical protein
MACLMSSTTASVSARIEYLMLLVGNLIPNRKAGNDLGRDISPGLVRCKHLENQLGTVSA